VKKPVLWGRQTVKLAHRIIIQTGNEKLTKMILTNLSKLSCELHIIVDSKRNIFVGFEAPPHLNIVSVYEFYKISELKSKNIEIYNKVYNELISDPRLFFLAERTFGNLFWRSIFNQFVKIECAIVNAIEFINKCNPHLFIFLATPHNVTSWIIGRTAEIMGVRVVVIESAPNHEGLLLYRGIDEQKIIEIEFCKSNSKLSDHNKNVLRKNRISSNSGAINKNNYDEDLMFINGYIKKYGSIEKWKLRSELKFLSLHPIGIILDVIHALKKRNLMKLYNDLAVKDLIGDKIITFFLQFQPERTSLPEGAGYAQQWIAIRQLSTLLPAQWKLIIREHPSMFTTKFDSSVRDEDFYKNISKLPNAELSSLSISVREVIEKSSIIVTLTGDVGFQALMRGKKVIALGCASYSNHENCYRVRNFTELKDVMAEESIFKQNTNLRNNIRYLKYITKYVYPFQKGDYWESRYKAMVDISVEIINKASLLDKLIREVIK